MLVEEPFQYEDPLQYDKKSEVRFTCSFKKSKASPILELDLANSYYWSGSFLKDYLFFIANWHPLLSTCLCHPAHPWTKAQRLIMLMVSVSFTTLPSARLLRVVAKQDGIAYAATHLGIFLHVTLPVMIWESALYRLAVLDLYCKGRQSPCCKLFVHCIRVVRHCCFLLASVISGLMVLGSFLILASSDAPVYDALRPVAVSCMQSWILWFPIWMTLPYIGFCHYWGIERRRAKRGAKQEQDRDNGLEMEDSWKLLEGS